MEKLSEENKSFLASVIELNVPNTEQELLILTIHAVLLKNGFRIISCSDNGVENAAEIEGLAMPDIWRNQQDPDCYEFVYVKADTKHVYNLRALTIDEKLHVNLLRKGLGESQSRRAELYVADVVQRKQRPISLDWLKNVDDVWRCLEDGLVAKDEKLDIDMRSEKREETQQQTLQEMDHSSLLVERPYIGQTHPRGPPITSQQQHLPGVSPFAFGDADRLPGHPGMGGMLMDPLRSGGLGLRPPSFPGVPRGSVPPGARFDPFGPLTEFDYSTGSQRPRRSFDPNPDHLRRPGFDDDMFM